MSGNFLDLPGKTNENLETNYGNANMSMQMIYQPRLRDNKTGCHTVSKVMSQNKVISPLDHPTPFNDPNSSVYSGEQNIGPLTKGA